MKIFNGVSVFILRAMYSFMHKKDFKIAWRDVGGAFADGAILFPLLAALSLQAGMNGTVLLASAGALYIVAGFIFRVPMAVQPLKAVAVAALALGATAAEISLSGFLVGLFCLALSFLPVDKIADKVPRHLIHGLQLALGIMLMTQGAKWGRTMETHYIQVLVAALTLGILFWSFKTDRPVMGWVASAGLLVGIYFSLQQQSVASGNPGGANIPLRPDMILSLVLPQMVLTLANSVIGTKDVADRYFKDRAVHVTHVRLLRSIGIGNVLLASLGGLPFCHGAGGITAHVKGGALHWTMNLIVGLTLLVLAGLSFILALQLIPAYPGPLMAILLFATGWFHLGLAGRSWQQKNLRWILILMSLTALVTQSMLWTLAVGIACDMIRRYKHAFLR